MSEQVCVYKRHAGKRRDASLSRLMIDKSEYDADQAEAKKTGGEPFYMLSEMPGGNSFDQASKPEQNAELKRQADRAKQNELAAADAAE